ncbi:hypothetical protein [Facilibium subflavum]|uniref:hypothetical protein n=1 Tax=Facilibium subflavum TaxID=2219058 RepID=UPI000E647DA1|nr:hypothetical protein [Facilibium subflavum]
MALPKYGLQPNNGAEQNNCLFITLARIYQAAYPEDRDNKLTEEQLADSGFQLIEGVIKNSNEESLLQALWSDLNLESQESFPADISRAKSMILSEISWQKRNKDQTLPVGLFRILPFLSEKNSNFAFFSNEHNINKQLIMLYDAYQQSIRDGKPLHFICHNGGHFSNVSPENINVSQDGTPSEDELKAGFAQALMEIDQACDNPIIGAQSFDNEQKKQAFYLASVSKALAAEASKQNEAGLTGNKDHANEIANLNSKEATRDYLNKKGLTEENGYHLVGNGKLNQNTIHFEKKSTILGRTEQQYTLTQNQDGSLHLSSQGGSIEQFADTLIKIANEKARKNITLKLQEGESVKTYKAVLEKFKDAGITVNLRNPCDDLLKAKEEVFANPQEAIFHQEAEHQQRIEALNEDNLEYIEMQDFNTSPSI